MKKTFLLVAISVSLFLQCTPDPTACFTTTSESIDNGYNPIVGEDITFENCSEEADSYYWDFGNGEISTDAKPKYTYEEGGEYTITLEATNKKSTTTSSYELEVLSLSGEWECISILYTEMYEETLDIEQINDELEGDLEGIDIVDAYVDEFEIDFNAIYYYDDYTPQIWKYTGEINEDYDEMEGTFKIVYEGQTYTDPSFTWSAEKTKSKSSSIKLNNSTKASAVLNKLLTN
jgi:PKD repeat protein